MQPYVDQPAGLDRRGQVRAQRLAPAVGRRTGVEQAQPASRIDAPELREIRGIDLFSAISDASLRELWRLILADVRKNEAGRTFDLRCDAPSLRRFIALDVRLHEKGGVRFSSRETRIEVREPVRLLDRRTGRNDSLLLVCAWCARIQGGTWLPIEEAMERLKLFEQQRLPRISHGICPECFARTVHAS